MVIHYVIVCMLYNLKIKGEKHDLLSSDKQSTNKIFDNCDDDPTWSLNPSHRFNFTPRRQFSLGLDQTGPSGISKGQNLVIEVMVESSNEEPVLYNPRPTSSGPTSHTLAAPRPRVVQQ